MDDDDVDRVQETKKAVPEPMGTETPTIFLSAAKVGLAGVGLAVTGVAVYAGRAIRDIVRHDV